MGRVAHAGDRAAVQARRTTAFAVPTSFSDITLDSTDIETDAATIEHAVATDNITLVRDGLYRVHYHFEISPTGDTNSVAIIEARVRINDTTVLDGSELYLYVFNDTSLDSEDITGSISCSFLVKASAGDFLTLQANMIEDEGDPVPDLVAGTITFTVTAEFN